MSLAGMMSSARRSWRRLCSLMTPRWGPPRRSGSGWFRYRHATFAPLIYLMYQFYQDRLGTNTGKHSKQEWRFLRVDTARARQSAGRWLTCCQRVRHRTQQPLLVSHTHPYLALSCRVVSCLVLSCLVLCVSPRLFLCAPGLSSHYLP